MTTPIVTTVATASPAPAPTADASTPDALAPELARELAHEQAMCNRGRDRYFNNCSRLQGRNAEANTIYGKGPVKRGIEPLRAAIEAFMEQSFNGAAGRRHKAANMLQGMDYTVVAFITLRKLITEEPAA
ncbi:MAG: hypothetical protein IJA79_09525 [Desulfovibrio sp.]|nr:hypothetical protein [Desulfovibrio sp.]